jgi:hypothetical protein
VISAQVRLRAESLKAREPSHLIPLDQGRSVGIGVAENAPFFCHWRIGPRQLVTLHGMPRTIKAIRDKRF